MRRWMLSWVLLNALAASSPAWAQVDEELRAALQQLGATQVGPTVDAALAQRLLRRGNTYSNLERHDEAADEYRQALSADPRLAEAAYALANTYYFLERFADAKPLYARFVALDPGPGAPLVAAMAHLGELERRDRNYDRAVVFDLQSIALDPRNDSQVHIMANTYANDGRVDLALRIYSAASVAVPDNAFYQRSLGRLLEQEGRLEEALRAYEQAAAIDPESTFYADLVESTRARLSR